MNTTFWDAFQQLTLTGQVLFFAALGVAFAFEFINGFHDTANAVTTVIYTVVVERRSRWGSARRLATSGSW